MNRLRKGQLIIINHNTYLRQEAKSGKDFSGEEKDGTPQDKNRTIMILDHDVKTKKIIATSTTSGKKLKNGKRYYAPKFAYKDVIGNTFIKFQVIEFDEVDLEGEYKFLFRMNSNRLDEYHKTFKERRADLYDFYKEKVGK